MLVRFTEFVTLHEQDICLYVIREEDENEPCFSVQMWASTNTASILCKKISDNWEIVTQDVPQWVLDIKREIIEAIELRAYQD